MIYKNTAILLSVFLSCTTVYSQQSVNHIVNHIQEQASVKPSELIYLQTSKGIYETGEDLWFKAYQLDVQTFGLSGNSKTLYLQMMNSEDSVVWQEKYPVENGIVTGHVYIDEKLAEGDYFLEGYTRYSFYRNDPLGITPARKIKIVKNITRSEVTENPKDTAFRFEIFPEGGNLVSGLSSRLAFKATDGRGNPVSVEGNIYQEDTFLCEIKSVHNGMGAVLFTPLQDKQYRIELKNGKSYPLPEIHSQGMALKLSGQDKKQLAFVVSKSGGLPDRQIVLMGQMRGKICCMARGTLRDSLEISIPLDHFLYQGIAEFTLFDGSMQPVAERLVYVHPQKKLYITAEPEKRSFTIREKAAIKIKATDEDGRPVRANLGISVYDRVYNNPTDPVNILVYSYLFSQIRGRIFAPAYYFDEKNSDRKEAMDLLLLTQGWRRYVWNTGETDYRGESFLTDEINGSQTIMSKRKNKENKGVEQLVQVSGADGNAQLIWTDSAGHFMVEPEQMKVLRGGYVYLKPMLSEEFKPALELTDYFPLIDSIRKNKPRYYPIPELSNYKKEQILDLPVVSGDSTILLEAVTVTAKGKRLFRDKFMGRLDSLAQIALGPWVCEHGHLENYKEGYTVHHDPRYCPMPTPAKERHAPIIGKAYRIIKPKYSVYNGTLYFIIEASETVIYQGANYSEEDLLRMNNLWRTKGYYASREFYQPDETDIQLSTPDARNTLLWAPSVMTDENGEATVSFYCSDINTGFIGIVEGVDGAGLLGNANCEFRVIR